MIFNEKALIFEEVKNHSEIWLLEDIFDYIVNHSNDDPLGIMSNPMNEYALQRAQAYGLQAERREKYARDGSSSW